MQVFTSVTDRRRFAKSFTVTAALCALLCGIGAIDRSAHAALGKNAADLYQTGGIERFFDPRMTDIARSLLRGISPYISLGLEIYLRAVRVLSEIGV